MRHYGPVFSGEGRLRVSATACPVGDDWVMFVEGGDTPHVGANALACPCDAPTNTSGEISAFVSTLSAPGHRDDVLARDLALLACKSLRRNISLSLGIHVHSAAKEEIVTLVGNAEKALVTLLELLTE